MKFALQLLTFSPGVLAFAPASACRSALCDFSRQVWAGPDKGCVPAPPPCDFGREDYKLNGAEMACVPRQPPAGTLVWYNMDHGKCSIAGPATATSLQFTFSANSGVLYTNAPYKYVLKPSEVEVLSDMGHYEGKAVAVSLLINQQTVLYVGTVRQGVLVGEMITGNVNELQGAADVDCILNEVQVADAMSAVGFGQCVFSGDGHLTVAIDTARIFSGAGSLTALTDMSIFEGLNAATYDLSGNYDVFTVGEANATHVSGRSYFSTRLQTWQTTSAQGEPLTEACSLFVDLSDRATSCQLTWWTSGTYVTEVDTQTTYNTAYNAGSHLEDYAIYVRCDASCPKDLALWLFDEDECSENPGWFETKCSEHSPCDKATKKCQNNPKNFYPKADYEDFRIVRYDECVKGVYFKDLPTCSTFDDRYTPHPDGVLICGSSESDDKDGNDDLVRDLGGYYLQSKMFL